MTSKDRFIPNPDVVVRQPFRTPPELVVRRTVELAEIPAPTGLEAAATFTAASTDANAAHAAGVPAIAIGVTTGAGEHTLDEWIDTSQLGTGLGCAAATITAWERGAWEGEGA
jgi:hypothetical protein